MTSAFQNDFEQVGLVWLVTGTFEAQGYRVFSDGTLARASEVNRTLEAGTSFFVQIQGIQQGNRQIPVQLVDSEGRESALSAPVTVYVDNNKPTAPTELRIDEYDSQTGCFVLSFTAPDGDQRRRLFEITDQRGDLVARLRSDDYEQVGEDRFRGESCEVQGTDEVPLLPNGSVSYLQAVGNVGSNFPRSVKLPPLRFQATSRNVPRGFEVSVGADGRWTASWDAPSSRVGATKFVVLNRLEPIVEVSADERSVTFDLVEGRNHCCS